MRIIRTSAVLVWLGTLTTASVGQESQPPAAPAQAPAPQPDAKPPAAAPPAATPTPPPPSAAAPKGGVIRGDEFIPTQEVQADEEVTFPVDI
jgi:hypothetical protein